MIDEQNVSEIISDIETPAFGYSRKLIIAKDTGLFKKDGKKKNAKTVSTREKLNEYIKNNIDIINEMAVVIFTINIPPDSPEKITKKRRPGILTESPFVF